MTAELIIDEDAISGKVTDEAGITRRFEGWLSLIAMLQPPSQTPARLPTGEPDSPLSNDR